MGWSTIENGRLLTLAAAHFDVFVTVDRNLSFQQNFVTFDIAVIILRAKSWAWLGVILTSRNFRDGRRCGPTGTRVCLST
jgi:hypothetical protein